MNEKLDCKAVSRMLSDSLERGLDPEERIRLTTHFGLCDTCRNVDLQMSLLHQAMKLLGADHPSHY